MELALERDDATPEFAKVTKRMKDAAGNPIGTAHDNPVLDTRSYEVKHLDGHKAAMSAKVVAENTVSQVDHDGHCQMLFETIIDHRNNGTALQEGEASVKNSSGVIRNVETTKGWKSLIQWHDGSTAWNKMKDLKDSYPAQLAEHAAWRIKSSKNQLSDGGWRAFSRREIESSRKSVNLLGQNP
jgi:hypothetical protein